MVNYIEFLLCFIWDLRFVVGALIVFVFLFWFSYVFGFMGIFLYLIWNWNSVGVCNGNSLFYVVEKIFWFFFRVMLFVFEFFLVLRWYCIYGKWRIFFVKGLVCVFIGGKRGNSDDLCNNGCILEFGLVGRVFFLVVYF